jgi:hypothetical protein
MEMFDEIVSTKIEYGKVTVELARPRTNCKPRRCRRRAGGVQDVPHC